MAGPERVQTANMKRSLTVQHRHEIFCREWIKTGSNTKAYLKAYPGPFKPKCAGAASARLRAKPYIKKRIEELQMRINRKADITFEKILNDFQAALEMAAEERKPGDMISAAKEQARLVGLLVERKETGQPGDFDKMEDISEVLEAVAEEAGADAAMALAKAFSLVKPEVTKNAPAQDDAEALIAAEPGSDAVN